MAAHLLCYSPYEHFPKRIHFIFKQNLPKILLTPRGISLLAMGMKYYKTSFERRIIASFVYYVGNYNVVYYSKRLNHKVDINRTWIKASQFLLFLMS